MEQSPTEQSAETVRRSRTLAEMAKDAVGRFAYILPVSTDMPTVPTFESRR
jgi:hypothetical protein